MYSSPGMLCRTVYMIVIVNVLSQSAGELVIAPQSTAAKVGDTTYFNCSTSLTSEAIFWYHGLKYVYSGSTIIEPYDKRFEIDRNASDLSYNLVIRSVEPSDAGEYICVDDGGSGKKRSAELVVLDNDPDCGSNIHLNAVIGQNIFHIPIDDVRLTCNATYHGNIPPQMEWKKVGDNRSIIDNVTHDVTSNNRVVYTLKLKGDISLDKSSYICQTKRSTLNHPRCISETINVLYFLDGRTIEQDVVRGEKVTCIDNNNTFPCTKQWYIGNYDSCPLSCDATITTHVLGKYLCRLKCNVRGIDHYFDALNATVVDATTSSPPSMPGGPTIAVAVVIPISIVLVALIAVFFVRHKKLKYLERTREDKQRESKFLMARIAFVNYGESLKGNEIELIHKIKKQTSPDLPGSDIIGIAILVRKLFIVRDKISQLEVYDCNNFNVAPKTLNVPELVAAVDMCCCQTNNCLYIMDNKIGATREVLKISTNGELVIKWTTKHSASGYLSTTTEGNVIITVQEKQMLLEYSSDGELVCKIKLPECNNPWHAVKLADGRYVVSHGMPSDPLIRVCLVDKEGHVDESFGPKSESAANQLNMPVYLAVGSSGCVIVADLFKSRVLLLDPNLKFQANMVPKYKQGFRNPKRVCLNEKLLAVVIAAGKPTKTIHDDEVDHKTEVKASETSTEKNALLTEEGTIQAFDSSQKIDRDCRLLVFNMEPLLTKHDG